MIKLTNTTEQTVATGAALTFNSVLIHELGHAALFSYGLLPDIHKAVKRQYWMEAEEWVCNFIADYGMRIFSIAYEVMGEDAWMFIPYELDRLIA